jgi:uncharacterized cupin superfamily protein
MNASEMRARSDTIESESIQGITVTIININECPITHGSRYPAPYDQPCQNKHTQALGSAADLTQFGVNLVRIEPGAWSSQRHWHQHEDEFIWVVEGEAVLITDEGNRTLRAGECVGFKAGMKDGHHFVNESDVDAILLVVGTRDDRDHGEYPDIDLRFCAGRYTGSGGYYETKDGKKIG